MNNVNKPLQDKVAIVTGGARGIGAAIARRLADDGATVVVNYTKAEDAARRVVDEITAAGGRATAVRADVGNADDVRTLFRHVDEAYDGRVDVLVNNAGIAFFGEVGQTTEEQFDQMVDTNVRGVFLATTEAVRRMPRGGRVITIGSVNGDRMPFSGGALYAMSKSAVQGLTRGWARDLGPRGITANLVQPGPIDTDLNPAQSAFADTIRPGIAIGRYGTSDEVAALVAFLAGPGSSNMTASIIDVDGGFNA